MHELGVLSAVVKTVEDIAKKENIQTITKLVLEVGELSGMVPRYIENCYPAAVYKTFLENTELDMNVVEGIVKCKRCGEEFSAYKNDFVCPICKGKDLDIISGKDFIIKEIIVPEDE